MTAPKDRKDLVSLIRDKNMAPEDSELDEEQIDQMVDELADELGIDIED